MMFMYYKRATGLADFFLSKEDIRPNVFARLLLSNTNIQDVSQPSYKILYNVFWRLIKI